MISFYKTSLTLAIALYTGNAMAQITPSAHRNPINTTNAAAQKMTGTGSRLLASSHYSSSGTVLNAVDSQKYAYPNANTSLYNQQYTYQYASMAWSPNLKYDYTYNTAGKLTFMNVTHWATTSSSYTNQSQTNYTLNTAGVTTLSLSQLWLPTTSVYRDQTKTTYMLNSANVPTDKVYQLWDPGSNALLNTFHYTYTLNAQNNILTELKQDWDASIHWYNDYRTTYTYDASGQHITSTTGEQWNINTGAWVYTYQQQNTLNAAGVPVSAIYKIWNTSTNAFANYYSIVFTYDAAGNNTQNTYQLWNAASSTYVNSIQNNNTFNTFNQTTSTINLYWNGTAFAIGQYTNKYNYYYENYNSSTTGIPAANALQQARVYPTVCVSQLFIDNLKQPSTSYHIVAGNGAVVATGLLPQANNTIPVGNLAAGMYFIVLQSANAQATFRMQKQ